MENFSPRGIDGSLSLSGAADRNPASPYMTFHMYIYIYIYLFIYVPIDVCMYVYVYRYIYISLSSILPCFLWFRHIRSRKISIINNRTGKDPSSRSLGAFKNVFAVLSGGFA